MNSIIFKDKYPIFYLEIPKQETSFQTVAEILAYFRQQIEQDDIACYIGLFDHYSHTQQLAQGEISEEILEAQHILFCFGIQLPTPRVMSVRPRSIGVCELLDRFTIDYLEAPMPIANQKMAAWSHGVRNGVTAEPQT